MYVVYIADVKCMHDTTLMSLGIISVYLKGQDPQSVMQQECLAEGRSIICFHSFYYL